MLKPLQQLIADLYGFSDRVVVYSGQVRGTNVEELQESLVDDHELLDALYHQFQEQLSYLDKPYMTGRELFELSDIDDSETNLPTKSMVEDVRNLYILIIDETNDYLEGCEDHGLKKILQDFLAKAKKKYIQYRDYLK